MSYPNSYWLAGLRTARLKADIDPQLLADRVGVTLSHYYRYEAGTRQLLVGKAFALADMLGCTLDELRNAPAASAGADIVVIAPGEDAQAAAAQLSDWELPQ